MHPSHGNSDDGFSCASGGEGAADASHASPVLIDSHGSDHASPDLLDAIVNPDSVGILPQTGPASPALEQQVDFALFMGKLKQKMKDAEMQGIKMPSFDA
eukprot:12431322-Karenia_brevis.AAC.1